MNIVKTQSDHLLVCRLEGRFDAHQVPRLKTELETLSGPLRLDFSGVTFIDSSGLAALVTLYKRARAADVAFEISDVQDAVRLILELTGLDSILPISTGSGPDSAETRSGQVAAGSA